MPAGRPSDYKPELVKDICDRIACGESLQRICKEDGYPDRVTILRWLEKHEEFRTQYARAREYQQELWSEKIIEEAEASMGLPSEGVQASKLIVDTRKWLMSKLAPKKYGEKTTLLGAGEGETPLIPKSIEIVFRQSSGS